jgi:hypothetical protein
MISAPAMPMGKLATSSKTGDEKLVSEDFGGTKPASNWA